MQRHSPSRVEYLQDEVGETMIFYLQVTAMLGMGAVAILYFIVTVLEVEWY